jgi:hypothetical protein
MDSLPNELQCSIASHLSTTIDIAAYRLVSKRFASLGAPSLFENFTCSPTPSTLSRLHHILQSPYAKHIKTIDFESQAAFSPRNSEEHALEVDVFGNVVKRCGQRIRTLWVTYVRCEVFVEAVDDEFIQACTKLTYALLFFDALPYQTSRRHTVAFNKRLGKKIRCLLGEAKDLEDITLHFDNSFSHGWGKERLNGLEHFWPADNVWPALLRLNILAFATTPQDLVQLLKRHKDTLRCVHLEDIWLDLGDGDDEKGVWREVFGVLAEIGELEHGVMRKRDVESVKEVWMLKVGGREVEIQTNLSRYLVDGPSVEEEL